MVLDLVLLVLCALLGAFGNRFAGGLLSVWVKHDLGDTRVRILWGLLCTPPLFIFLGHATALPWWGSVLVILAGGVLQGLMRGAGWSGSLLLGFQNKKPTKATLWQCVLMTERTLLMNLVIWAAAAGVYQWHHAWGVVIAVVFWLVTGLAWTGCYLLANLKPLQFPLLGMTRNDPPPTAEFMCGGITPILLFLFCWLM